LNEAFANLQVDDTMDREVDIAVVGGGPCGSYAALTASKLGAEVLVCEEHGEVGSPTHCAGHVSINGLKQLGLKLPEEVFENEFRGAFFYPPSCRELVVDCRKPVTMSIDRALFDKYLSTLAENHGVRYMLGSKVSSLLLDRDQVVGIKVRSGSSEHEVRSRVVVDAEGAASFLSRKIGLQKRGRSMVLHGVNADFDAVEDVNPDFVEAYLGGVWAPGFFCWIIPRRDGSAKVGLAVKDGNPRLYLERFIRKHPVASKKLSRGRIRSLNFHPIPLWEASTETYCSGLLVVGDAASQVKPTTGGGLNIGLLCSRLAGGWAYRAVAEGDVSERFLAGYQSSWRRAVGFDLAVMLRLRRMFNRLSDRRIDSFFNAFRRLRLHESLGSVRDIDLQGHLLAELARKPEVFLFTLYFFLLSSTSKT